MRSYLPIVLSRIPLLAFILISVLWGIGTPGLQVFAQQPSVKNGEYSLTSLEADKKAIESDNNQDEIVKLQIVAVYNQAIKALQDTLAVKEQLEQLKILIQGATQRISEIRIQLQAPEKANEPDWNQLTIDQVEQQFKQQDLAVQSNKEKLKQKEETLNLLLLDSQKLSEKIVHNNRILQDISQELKTLAEDNSAMQKARLSALSMRKGLRQTEIELWQQRFSQHDLLTNLAQAERNLLVEQISAQQRLLDSLRKHTQQLREKNAQEARQEAEQLQKKSNELPPPIQRLADETAVYRVELENVLKEEQSISSNLIKVRTSLDGIKTDFERIKQRVNLLGATDSVNKLLRKRKQNLPSIASFRETVKGRREVIAQVTDRQLAIDDRQRDLVDSKTLIEQLTEKINAQAANNVLTSNGLSVEESGNRQQEKTLQLITQHLQAKRDALNELQKVYGRYISQLSALDLVHRERIDVVTELKRYIDIQLLWIPNTNWKQLLELNLVFPGLSWIVNTKHLTQAVTAFQNIISENALLSSLFIFVCLLIQFYYTVLHKQLARIGLATRKIRTDSMLLTLKAVFLTLLLAMPWPLFIIYTGWLLQQYALDEVYINALGGGFIYIGIIFLALSLIRQTCRKGGLGEYHLRWPKEMRESLRKELTLLLWAVFPLGIVATFGNNNDSPNEVQLLGRYAFIAILLLISLTIFRLFRKKSALMTEIIGKTPDSLIIRLHFLWFSWLIILGVALIFASIAGYHYTAWHFQQQLLITLWLLIGLWIAKDLLLRWLYIIERRLRFDEAVRRREEIKAHRDAQTVTDLESEPLPSEDIPEINYSELSEQAHRLFYVGFLFCVIISIWFVWRDWIPSLNLFFQTELPIQTTKTIDGISKSVPLSIADVILAFMILFLTVLAGKNLPGVLEITLLQHLPLESGSRYAITALSQYTIIGVGVIMTFSYIGMQWSSIQWLVAALSVGLGFGLQEIVANFISGIILLFERPIRPGDLVTVGDVSGRVSKINIRATTIITFEKQELLVPNKEFITGRVLNWTLSNTINRVTIEVGIAYGSDVDKAMALLTEAACEGSRVLEDPEPVVSFDMFGDNSLILKARCYLSSVDDRVFTITEVNKLVNKKFHEAGIEIAFPQRDVHIDTANPFIVHLSNNSLADSIDLNK